MGQPGALHNVRDSDPLKATLTEERARHVENLFAIRRCLLARHPHCLPPIWIPLDNIHDVRHKWYYMMVVMKPVSLSGGDHDESSDTRRNRFSRGVVVRFWEVAMSQTSQPGDVRNVVLVHGGWVDGSGWEGAQRLMAKRASATVVEVKGSHAIYVSQPQAVASLIEKAAQGVRAMATRQEE